MADASRPSWRDSGNEPADSGGARPWQPGDAPSADSSALPAKRSLKRTIAFLSLIAIFVAMGYVIVLLRPIKPACLVLIGSGYESNLLLPHNACGWHGLSVLEAEVTDQEMVWRFPWDQPTKMRRVGDRIELKDRAWKDVWEDMDVASYKEKTVVLFFSMHGLADKDEAYLLANASKVQSVQTFLKARIPFRDVLDSLKGLKNKKVLLLLDVSHTQTHWPIGMLQNEFVTRLQEKYEGEIKDMGNLVVICSASGDQRSWASDELQNSVFGHYVTQGLKGVGQGSNERVNAFKLFKYVEDKVDRWAQTNRARGQKPILLGKESAAKDTELVHIADPPPEAEAPAPKLEVEALKAEWGRWKDLKERTPYVSNPQLWRLYQETLLRFEQLVRIGDPTKKASDLKARLENLAKEIAVSRAQDRAFASLGNNFPMHQVLGYRAELQDVDELYIKLRKNNTDEERKKLVEALGKKSLQERQYLQTRLGQILLTELDQTGKLNLAREQDWLADIERELRGPRRPAEVHLLKMLKEADAKQDDATLRLALRVRVLAEQAALSSYGSDSTSELYSEAIFSWIRSDIVRADDLRRKGEDALFGDPTLHGDDARAKLKDAQKVYQNARDQALHLQQAMALRDELSAELPFFADWLALLPAMSGQNKADIKALRESAETLGLRLADLNRDLDADKKLTPKDALNQMASDLKAVRDEYQGSGEKLKKAAVLQQNWHGIDSLLRIPPADRKEEDVTQRLNLLSRLRYISGQLLDGANTEGKEEEVEAIAQCIARQRKIVRAVVKSAEDIQGDDKDAVDEKVRNVFLKLPKDIVEKSEGAAGDLLAATKGCRTIPGALAEQVRGEKGERVNPVDRLRRIRTYRLLNALAVRTLEDHWYEPGPNRETYYVPAGKAYLEAARALFDPGQMSETLVKESDALQAKMTVASLVRAKQPSPYWTTEFDFPLPWQIQAEEGVPRGTPMIWLEVKKGNKTEKLWLPEPRKPMTPWPTPTEPFADPFRLNRTNLFDDGDVTVTFHALYRGHNLTDTLTLVRAQPKVIVRHFPAPDKTGIAVRMDSAFDYGAISIVLDNTGTMDYVHPKKNENDPDRPATKGETSRFKYALDALRQVLAKVPDNTHISIVNLGAKKVTGAVVFREPTLWRQNKIDDWMADLEEIDRDYDTPLAKGVLLSMKKGFPENYKGPKVVLVLTDGIDNYSYDETKTDPKGNTAAVVKALAQANQAEPDIDVVVVCFIDEKDKDFQISKDQFDGVKKFTPKSDFIRQPKGEDLGRTIEDLIRPRVQLLLDGTPAPGFKVGLPANYHRDLALKWNPLAPNNYRAKILRTYANDIAAEMAPGQNLFAVLKRKEKKLYLERGILANQPEVAKLTVPIDAKDDWKVTLLENHNSLTNKLSQMLSFEKADMDEPIIRQVPPGFAWLELETIDGKKPEQTLTWGRDWSVPASALRLEIPGWPLSVRPKMSAWFTPDDREKLLLNEKVVVKATVAIDTIKPTTAFASLASSPVIESVLWETHDVDSPSGGKTKENCLVVRARHAKGRPVWIGLEKNRPESGSEVHYYPEADRCTAYFYKLPKLADARLVLVDVEAFKEIATRVEFAPEQRYRAPKMFLNGSE